MSEPIISETEARLISDVVALRREVTELRAKLAISSSYRDRLFKAVDEFFEDCSDEGRPIPSSAAKCLAAAVSYRQTERL